MIKWIIAFALMVVILGMALDVFAGGCRIISIVKPDGTITNCTVCDTIVNCL
jgi:hypothetical protein